MSDSTVHPRVESLRGELARLAALRDGLLARAEQVERERLHVEGRLAEAEFLLASPPETGPPPPAPEPKRTLYDAISNVVD